MKVAGNARRAHVLVFPYPSQGHINPLLQFAKRLVYKGLTVSLATTVFLSKTMEADLGAIELELVSDGCDEKGVQEAGGFEAYHERLRTVGPQSLVGLLRKLDKGGRPVDCLVYDSCMPWALEVGKEAGLPVATFLTQSCVADIIYWKVYHGGLVNPDAVIEAISLPGLPKMGVADLPSFIAAPEGFPELRAFVLDQVCNVQKADWVLCNTVEELEGEMMNCLRTILPVKAVGPTLPSLYLDNRIPGDDDYGISIWKKERELCRDWLDSHPAQSVVYVSFGSLASLRAEHIQETAHALKALPHPFLWVLRASETSKLPPSFAEETRDRGLIVNWCPQLEVLSHGAVGCFVTHCGWGSTLEALSLGVPMVACPIWTDQPTNAKYIEEVWGVGVRAVVDEHGTVEREEMMRCVREVMEGEGRRKMKENADRWSRLASAAVGEGGSSDRNIDEFVAGLA